MLSGRLLSYLKKRKISRNGHSLSLVVIRCHSLYHSLSLVVIRCHSLYHSLSFVVTCCHSLSLVVPLVVIRCHSLYHSLSLVVIRCHSLYHSLSLVVTRCTTRLSFYKRSISILNFTITEWFYHVTCFCQGFSVIVEKL